MYDIVRSNNIPVNDMAALMSGLINDLDKVIKTKRSQSLKHLHAISLPFTDCALNEAAMNGCTFCFFLFTPRL